MFKTNSSNIEKLTKNDIIGIYTNNEQLYVVFSINFLFSSFSVSLVLLNKSDDPGNGPAEL